MLPVILVLTLFTSGLAAEMNGKRLMSKLGECGSWNNLADIDCTAAPKLKVHYIREMHDLKLRMISNGVTPEIHAHLLATNQSYALINNATYMTAVQMSIDSLPVHLVHSNDVESIPQRVSNLRGASPLVVLPPSPSPSSVAPTAAATPTSQFPVTITGWYRYDASIGLSSATYLPQGLNTVLDADLLTVLSWVSCGCARYQWGNAEHTFITDVYGRPLIYLVANRNSIAPSTKPSLKSSAAPSTKPSLKSSVAPSTKPSLKSSAAPSTKPSLKPTTAPSTAPSAAPSASLSLNPSPAPSTSPSTAPSAPSAAPTVSPTAIPILVTGWYRYDASIGLSSATFLPQGLRTREGNANILQWVNCGCARYSWGNAAHTLVNDVYNHPIIYLQANAPTRLPTIAPSAPTARPTVAPTVSPTAIPILVTGWYQYDASIGLSSATFLPQGLDTLDGTYNLLYWITCGCARYSWGNAAHTLVNDVYNHPIIYLQSNAPSKRPTIAPSSVPSRLPTIAPSAPTARPTIRPSSAPQVPFYAPTAAPVVSKAPTNVVLPYNMVNHGGKILQVAVVKLIFWGPSWESAPGDKIYGMDLFYKGWTGSPYANILTEYSGNNGQVSSSINYQGYVVDSSTPSKNFDVGTILGEVCAQIPNPDPSGNGYYAVYTENKRGLANFCGWHVKSTCNGIPVQIAFFFNLDGDTSCGAWDAPSNPGWQMSQGVHSLADVSAHELAESITDPEFSSWFDSSNQEIADKCMYSFPASNPVFSNGITWRISGLWSNSAAIAGTGYPTNRNGVNVYGCVGSA